MRNDLSGVLADIESLDEQIDVLKAQKDNLQKDNRQKDNLGQDDLNQADAKSIQPNPL